MIDKLFKVIMLAIALSLVVVLYGIYTKLDFTSNRFQISTSDYGLVMVDTKTGVIYSKRSVYWETIKNDERVEVDMDKVPR